VELGPDPVLCAMATETLSAEGQEELTPIPTLREGRGETEAIALAIAKAHAQGAKLDWQQFFKGTRPKRVPLPTYPFQRERYWVNSALGAGDLSAAGQASADHPLLGAAVELAGEDGGLLLTGRISLATHPWLADHAVLDTVLLPGTAFVEIALQAAERCGAKAIGELTLQAPLVIPELGAVQLQVNVSGEDEQGERQISIHSRPQDGGEEGAEWAQHASGFLATTAPEPEPLEAWPPQGAEPVDTVDLYERFADAGFDYGPVFRGLDVAWRLGDEVFAEISLPADQLDSARRFAIHPALLDAALHAAVFGDSSEPDGDEKPGIGLPFSWSGVSVRAPGAGAVRVRLARDGDGRLSLDLGDSTGAPLARVDSLAFRPLSAERPGGVGRRGDTLLELEWTEVEVSAPERSPDDPPQVATLGSLQLPGIDHHEGVGELAAAIGAGAAVPQAVLFELDRIGGGDPAAGALAAASQALAILQRWLSEESLAGCRLCLVTEGAVAVDPTGSPNLPAASVWGLLRSAQSEHLGRFWL
ncbi:MAG TPA: polyketide synthase dehydratase domain-containing protein, partial [Solirubrobacterales bacterium]